MKTGLSVPDSLCTATPSPQKKSEKGCLWGGRDCTETSQTDNPFLALVWKRPITKLTSPVFLMIAKDCTERLSAVALPVGLIILRCWCFSGHVVRARSPRKCLDRDYVGRLRTGIRHGNVYRRVREKQGNVVYRQRVLQTVTSLRIVSLVFRGHDLLKIANINPQQEATLSLWKKLVPRESGGNRA